MEENFKIKKTTFNGIIGLLIFVGVIVVYFSFFSSTGSITSNVIESGKVGISIGDFAPDLTFKTINQESLSINDLKGKPVILQGFASWCPSCKTQSKEINKALLTLGDSVQVINIDIWQGETADDVRKNFINDVFISSSVPKNWEFTAYEPEFVTTYQVYAMDETYILDENGKIIFKDPQITRAETFLKILGD